MKKKNGILKRYIEAILYCIVLVIGIYTCLYGNIFINMIPIVFLIGILGYIVFEKKMMTSFFLFLLAIVMLQIKVPSELVSNLINSFEIGVVSILGEIFGFSLNTLIKKHKVKKNKFKDKAKYYAMCIVTLIFAIDINAIVHGDIFSYNIAKKSLYNYTKNEYSSSSRFKIVSSKYVLDNNPKYIFYTQDTLNNNNLARFIVYKNDIKNVQDEYNEKILRAVCNNIYESVKDIEKNNMDVKIMYDDTSTLTISFAKKIEQITKKDIEEFSKDIATYIAKAKEVKDFELIEQIKVTLESEKNSKDNVAAYIYMTGYNNMLQKNEEEPYQYIMKALNVEYFE